MENWERHINFIMTPPGFVALVIIVMLIQGFTQKRHTSRAKAIFEELARRHNGKALDGLPFPSQLAGFPLGGLLAMSFRRFGPMLEIPYGDYLIVIMYGSETGSTRRRRRLCKTIFSATPLAKGASLEHARQISGNDLFQVLASQGIQFTQLDGENNFSFTVSREDLFSNIGKNFGHQDIQVHQPEFDKAYQIKSNRENAVRELLSFDTQRALLELKDWQPRIFGQMGLCAIEIPRVFNNIEDFETLIRLGKRLLDGLKKLPGTLGRQP